MRVRFPRLPDGRRAFSEVERSDGVRYRIRQGVAGSELPDARVDASRVIAASEALRHAAIRWAALSPGEELVFERPEAGR